MSKVVLLQNKVMVIQIELPKNVASVTFDYVEANDPSFLMCKHDNGILLFNIQAGLRWQKKFVVEIDASYFADVFEIMECSKSKISVISITSDPEIVASLCVGIITENVIYLLDEYVNMAIYKHRTSLPTTYVFTWIGDSTVFDEYLKKNVWEVESITMNEPYISNITLYDSKYDLHIMINFPANYNGCEIHIKSDVPLTNCISYLIRYNYELTKSKKAIKNISK